MQLICLKCLHVGEPVRCHSKNAGINYRGCAKCAGGVFYSPPTP